MPPRRRDLQRRLRLGEVELQRGLLWPARVRSRRPAPLRDGSLCDLLRRLVGTVGDIELVCIPKIEERAVPVQTRLFGPVEPGKTERINLLDGCLDKLLSTRDRPIFKSVADLIAMRKCCGESAALASGVEDIRRWGPRYKRFYVWINDDLGVMAVDLFITTPSAWGAIFTLRTGPEDFSRALVTRIKYRTPYRQEGGCLVLKATGESVATPSEEVYFRLARMPLFLLDNVQLQRSGRRHLEKRLRIY